MAVAPTPVAAAPDAPDRAQRATFSARATAFFDWIKNTFVAGVNALASNVYANAQDAASSAANAVAQSASATAQAGIATAQAAAATSAAATATTQAGVATTQAASITTAAATSTAKADVATAKAAEATAAAAGASAIVLGVSTTLPALRPSLLLDFANSRQVDPRITFTRASTATRTNEKGLIETVATNVPRIDYDPVTLACKGLLVEEQRTNLLTYSEQFDNAAWAKLGTCAVSANAISAPDGTVSADLISNCTGYSNRLTNLTALAISGGGTYTFSVYVRSSGNGSEATLQLATYGGTYESVSVVKSLTQEWNRFNLQITTNSDNTGLFAIVCGGNGTSDLYLWGAQLEAGAFPTSYIPTAASAATRAAEVAEMTGTNFSSWYRADEGTFSLSWAQASTTSTSDLFALFRVSAGGSDAIEARVGYNTFRRVRAYGYAAGSFQYVADDLASAGSSGSCAVAWRRDTSDFALSANGAPVVADVTGSLSAAAAPTNILLGQGASYHLNGHIRRIAYYPKRLTNVELQGLTA